MQTSEPNRQRLQKVLASAGVASRRAAEDLIRSGRVSVNGSIVREMGVRVDARRDRIRVDGHRVEAVESHRYYLLHKPRGVVTTTRDPHARRTVVDLAPGTHRLFPVGRLDAASEGLVLMTSDGEVAQRLLHPSFAVPRTYRVSVEGALGPDALRDLRQGVELDGRLARAERVQLVEASEARSVLEMVLVEGRKHQIRRMLAAVGHPVRRLARIRFGPLELRGLSPGECRPLRKEERQALRQLLGRPRAAPPTQAGGS